ncbi:dipeptidyl aminopeptidase/acylaminoacyl peptidase [Crossiella equi]|uniref:Dipeptidyl aminopeptidase/acylaminoacyl peptidase n=1 Tax=Crossiella equi TaxID=130796 RepID=A0ABS5AQI3_9PSEU|nr:dipeptidyl aminopeptidase/acylaminoacyl peptidase [Crossiella equi]
MPGVPTLHGDRLVVAVTSPDVTADAYRGGLWEVPLHGGGPRRITHGLSDTQPKLSPDGRWLAFLRVAGTSGTAARPQLHVLPTAGGDAVKLTDLPLGAGVPAWAPDSASLAFTARVPEPGRHGTEEGVGPDAEAPRRITTLTYRLDAVGFLGDKPAQVHVVALPGADGVVPETRCLTELPVDAGDPSFTGDGTHVLFTAQRDLGTQGPTFHTDVYAVPVAGGEPVLVVRSEGTAEYPVADGDTVYFTGEAFTPGRCVAVNPALWSAPLALSGQPGTPVRLTEAETVAVERAPGPPVPVEGGVLVTVAVRGAVEVRLVPEGAKDTPLADLPLLAGAGAQVLGFTGHGGRVVAAVSTVTDPGELYLIGDEPVVLSAFNAGFRDRLRGWEEINTTAADGYPVHGWVLRPDGEGPHPVLLNIHGGPFRFYTQGFFDEAQVYARAGYAVVLGNPRGSASYGEAHGAALVGPGFGVEADTGDLLALLDAALAAPDLDAARVGVMGGSYGGFMTTWLAAHHGERFVAAWSERAVNVWDSFEGSSDIGWWFGHAYYTGERTEHEGSPLTHANKITIPVLIAHSEQDWRCPLEQAQRLFVALQRQGTPSELLIFPGEGHGLSREGRPRHRVQRFEAVLEWWDRHLPVRR